jgi:energy-coupling factor transporter ATP-binding protein EcfA2
MELSKKQIKVVNQAIHNVLEKRQASFITGPAGSGKTTIANRIAELLFQRGMNVYFAAPTHTASNRLQKILSSNDKQISVSTVHKFLGMRPAETMYGKTKFVMSDQTKPLEDDSILIIDEASMLSEEIYNNVITICGHRVIFLGDSCQIPPVTEEDDNRSRLLTYYDSEPPVKRHIQNVFELTEVFRQDNETSLYSLCKFIRDGILNGRAEDFYDDRSILLEKIYSLSDKDDTLFTDIPSFSVVPSLINITDTCFLAFGNPTVASVQSHLPEWYIDGGYGIINSPIANVMKVDKVTKFSIILPNNAHVQIESILKEEKMQWGVKFDKVHLIDEYGIEADAFVPSDPDRFLDDYTRWIEVAKFNGGKGNTLSKDLTALFRVYDYSTLDNDSLNEFMARVTTLREGRASTIHRAQGQQWDNCIIAFNNIMYAGINADKTKISLDTHRKIIAIKLLYTAVSRAKQKVIFCFEKGKDYKPRG